MNPVTFVVGLLLIGTGFVVMVRRLHDRSMHEALAVLGNARGNLGRAMSGLVGLAVPIVTSISVGLALVVVAALQW